MFYLHYPEIFTAILCPYYIKASGSQICSIDYSFFMEKMKNQKVFYTILKNKFFVLKYLQH